MVIELPVTGGTVLVDEEDAEWIRQRAWHISRHHSGIRYARNMSLVDGKPKTTYMHREILGLGGGRGVMVDHIDGDGLNNQRSNLRLVSHRQNLRNSRVKNLGTQKRGKGYMSRIYINGEQVYLGFFKTRREGELAYIRASLFYHGEYSVFHRPEWRNDERVVEMLNKLNCPKIKDDRKAELLRELAEEHGIKVSA